MKKRSLSIILMLAMVFSMIIVPQSAVATAADYYDTENLDCELAVDVLNALGIMSGYTDGSFLPYNSITRAEMAAIAVKLAGLEELPAKASEEAEQFKDMYDYDDWAGSMISIARSIGIAKGDADGNFNPDMSATYEDAVQMIVCALGYEAEATSRGGDIADYLYVAQKLGITKKVSANIGQNISRADVAKLVYAALTVDLMQQVGFTSDGKTVIYERTEGETALSLYFDAAKIEGVVYETGYAAIDGDTTLKEGQVLINGEIFETGATNISDYLGYYVEAYALDADDSTDNRKIIAFSATSVKNNTLTIIDENIDSVKYSVEGYTVNYRVNKTDKKTRTAKTSATPRVLYNGKALTNVTTELLIPETGKIVLIDNNGDDKYDIVDIWEYDLVYVLSASSTTASVVGYYDRSTTYKFDVEDDDYHVTFLNAYGGAASLSDIKQYSVLYVYQSLDKEEKKVIVSNGKVTGEITEIGDDEYVINGVSYKMSPGAEGRLGLAVMDSGDFYLDADNRIAGFEGSTVIRKNIGMFIAVNDGGLRRGYQMKVLTANNGVQIFDIASTVKVNDFKMAAADIYEYAYTDILFGLNTADTGLPSNLKRGDPSKTGFLYKLNSDGEICEMIIVGDGENKYLQRRQLCTEGSLYYSSSKHVLHFSREKVTNEFGEIVGKRTYVDSSTLNFMSDEAALNTDDNSNFWTKYMTTYSDNYGFFTQEGPDFVYAYYYSPDESEIDMQKTVCSFLVMTDWYDNSSDASTSDASQNFDARDFQPDTDVKFIHKITEAYDKNAQEQTYRVYYFDGTSLKNALIRPQYKNEAFLSTGVLYPNGYPVRISFDGSYIECVRAYFSNPYDIDGGRWTDVVQPVYNESTSRYVTNWIPFYKEGIWRSWYSGGAGYESRYYLGMITDVDEVVGQKVFSMAYANSATPATTSNINVMSNERLEGTVYRLNYDHEGYIDSVTKGSLEDLAPGQLVLVRKYAYDTGENRWYSLSGYAVREFIILEDSVEEIDHLADFYKLAMEKVDEVNANR